MPADGVFYRIGLAESLPQTASPLVMSIFNPSPYHEEVYVPLLAPTFAFIEVKFSRLGH